MKRSVPTLSFSKCIMCQETKKDVLFNATQQGLRSLKVSSEERRKLGDTANTDVIDAILEAIEGNKAEDLRWHKSCYAKYTDKGKISRLRKSLDFVEGYLFTARNSYKFSSPKQSLFYRLGTV